MIGEEKGDQIKSKGEIFNLYNGSMKYFAIFATMII